MVIRNLYSSIKLEQNDVLSLIMATIYFTEMVVSSRAHMAQYGLQYKKINLLQTYLVRFTILSLIEKVNPSPMANVLILPREHT